MRQAVTLQALPGGAAVSGLEQAAARPAAGAAPGVNLDLPHAGEKYARIVGVHAHVGATGVFVHEQNLVPSFATISGAEDAALGLRPIGVAQRAGQDDVRIARIDLHAADASGLFEAHQGPVLARVDGLVNPLAHGDVAADERFAGARPDDVGICRRDRQRADGCYRLFVEDGIPVDAAVAGFENATGSGAHIPDVGPSRHSGDGGRAVALRPDVAIFELTVHIGIDLRLLRLQQTRGGHERRSSDNYDET